MLHARSSLMLQRDVLSSFLAGCYFGGLTLEGFSSVERFFPFRLLYEQTNVPVKDGSGRQPGGAFVMHVHLE